MSLGASCFSLQLERGNVHLKRAVLGCMTLSLQHCTTLLLWQLFNIPNSFAAGTVQLLQP